MRSMKYSQANRSQLVLVFVMSSVLTHALGQVLPTSATSTGSASAESVSQSQPLWSYQVKPNSFANTPTGQAGHYSAMPTLFDAFNGLSQRQGALTGSPFLSILPIILIAAGGFLLLLPFLTMMMASPFSGGFGGGYGSGFGYPQLGALSKKRSLNENGQRGGAGLIDLIEHVSSAIDELTKKYSPPMQPLSKRSKSLSSSASGEQQQPPVMQAANHKPAMEETANNLS